MKRALIKCGYCNNEFKPTRKGNNYCSPICRKKAHYRRNNPIEDTICDVCHEMFTPNNNNELYCDDDCKKIAMNMQSSDWIRKARREHPDKYNNELGSKETSTSHKMHRKEDGSPDFEKELKWIQEEKKHVFNNSRNLFRLPTSYDD